MEKQSIDIGVEGIKTFISKALSPENRVKLIFFTGILAIVGIWISNQIELRSSQPTSAVPLSEHTNYDEYASQLEERLTDMISAVEGAGSVKVMVTLECGTEYIYASKQKTTSALSEDTDPNGKASRDEKLTGEESIILIEGDNGEQPLIQKEMTPTVAGVVVVCSGADDVKVKQRIIDIVTTALNTGSNRVCVTLMG